MTSKTQVFFILLATLTYSDQTSKLPVAEFLVDIQLYFYARSIILYQPIYKETNEENKNLIKKLSSLGKTAVLCSDENKLFDWKNTKNIVFYSHIGKFTNITDLFQFFNTIKRQAENIWVILLDSIEDESLDNIFIPFDCQFVIAEFLPDNKQFKMKEIYKTDMMSAMIKSEFGFWNRKHSLKVPPLEIFSRRNNFNRSVINVRPQYDNAGGVFGRVNTFGSSNWESIGYRLNFRTIYVNKTDTNYEVDLASHGFQMGMDNSGHLLPFVPIAVDLFYREPKERLVWDKYLDPFAGPLWGAILFWLLISASLMIVCIKLTQTIDVSPIKGFNLIYDAIFILVQKGSELSSSSLSVRMICFVQLFSSLVFFASYSAVFISFVTVLTTTVPFTTLEGVLENGQYNITVVVSKAYPFIKSNSHPTFKALLKKHVLPEDQMGDSFIENFHRVCSAKEKLMAELPKQNIGTLQSKLSCRISKASVPFLRLQSTWIFTKKNSYFQDIIRIWSWKLRECGSLSSMLLWRRDFLKKSFDESQLEPPKSIELLEVISLFVTLLIGTFLSFIALAIEIIVKNVNSRSRKQMH